MKEPKPTEPRKAGPPVPAFSRFPEADWKRITKFVYTRRKYRRYLKRKGKDRPGDFSHTGKDLDFFVCVIRGRAKSALKSMQTYKSLDDLFLEYRLRALKSHADTFCDSTILAADKLYFYNGSNLTKRERPHYQKENGY
jgi:hypothetical protein